MPLDTRELAREIVGAYVAGTTIASPPTQRDAAFDMSAAYAVEAELVRLGTAKARRTVGRKVGFASRALWRALKLDTIAWASMYDDTVLFATGGEATFSLGRRFSPRIEPEIVFKLKSPIAPGTTDPAAALAAVEWMALGFEIIDCPFPDWKFAPADFVAAYGFHAGLVVGTPVAIAPNRIAALVDALPVFTLKLLKDGAVVQEGVGSNVLQSPALCLGELAGAAARQAGSSPLAAGEIITTGALTAAQPIARDQVWRAEADRLGLEALTVRVAP